MQLSPLSPLPRLLSRRAFHFSTRLQTSPFKSSPGPPRLPKEDQEIFERLQRQSTGAFSTPRAEASATTPSTSTQSTSPTLATSSTRPQVNQSPASSSSETEVRFENGKAIPKGDDLHPNMRRGAPPEFEGDVNPRTGEVGGPKNEPLRWGGGGDWSYNGRVTDF